MGKYSSSFTQVWERQGGKEGIGEGSTCELDPFLAKIDLGIRRQDSEGGISQVWFAELIDQRLLEEPDFFGCGH